MNYEGILQFKGTWRSYQAQVLKNVDKYILDGKIHIVAAPGSGKTTLGIELIRRMNGRALILAPSITIREQWVARIEEAFLNENCKSEDYISQSLKEPKAITVATYQSLHSAMTRFAGTEKGDDDDDSQTSEEVNYSQFDLVKTMSKSGIEVICLDECHHLRSEWWKALEDFREQIGKVKMISLTATPPYDSTEAMWTRYMNMCGEIDEEITIPELVKENSLCPHQDYVYFNYPTKEEEEHIRKFQERSSQMTDKLMEEEEFLAGVRTHKGLINKADADNLFENPEYLTSFIIYLKAKNVSVPNHLQRLVDTKKLPQMSVEWMEKLLQGFLYDYEQAYICEKEYKEQLIDRLKSQGLIEKRKVMMTKNASIEKILTNSLGKCNSIKEIVFHEYDTTGENLRLLVLTDYIRKEYEKAIGNPDSDVNSIGVLPFFEMLRRENENRGQTIKFGVLCGTIVIIPAQAKEALEKEVEGVGKINFSKVGNLSEDEYIKVSAAGDAHFLTGAVTNIFCKGEMNVLIGTKSLLGEGWDSPCINSLILASFVGSFMLSNQMRGRAIRMWKDNPEKSSNIWHLVCLKPWSEVQNNPNEGISEDYSLLERRMEHFLGLHYVDDKIENGIKRLSIIKPPFNQENVEKINSQMLEMAGKRDSLKERWNKALNGKKINVIDENEVLNKYLTDKVYRSAKKGIVLGGISFAAGLFIALVAAGITGGLLASVAGVSLVVIGIITVLTKLPKAIILGSPEKRLCVLGNSLLRALNSVRLLEEKRCEVVTEKVDDEKCAIYLKSESGRDKTLFSQCIKDFFAPANNQRYILFNEEDKDELNTLYSVPECLSKRKEDAQIFEQTIKPYIGNYNLIYTRNDKGKTILLEERMKALLNSEER